MEEKNPLLFLSELQDFIEKRHEEMPEGSYTTSLFNDGLNRMAQKVGEEALELVIEATNGTNDRLIYEGAFFARKAMITFRAHVPLLIVPLLDFIQPLKDLFWRIKYLFADKYDFITHKI